MNRDQSSGFLLPLLPDKNRRKRRVGENGRSRENKHTLTIHLLDHKETGGRNRSKVWEKGVGKIKKSPDVDTDAHLPR